MLKAGFARLDITPPLGSELTGYYDPRYAEGILDPLYATAVVFDDGEKKAIVMSIDQLGINQVFMLKLRTAIAEAVGTDVEGVYIACTHTHLSPGIAEPTDGDKVRNPEYAKWFTTRLVDAATLALKDAVPSKMLYTRGEAKDVSFIRRFRMKDGSTRTNPGLQNPDILHPLCDSDDASSLLIIKREGKPEIGIVNFQVHPDVIGGSLLSADYPKFVRDTYESLIENSLCMYINGTQGDSNHVDVRLPDNHPCRRGYRRSRYMGTKIALSVVANYPLAEEIDCDKVNYANKITTVKYNKGTPEQIPAAKELVNLYHEKGEANILQEFAGMQRTTMVAEACRIVDMLSVPDTQDLYVSAVSVGDVVFVGFPGEPFTDMGRGVKENSKFTLTMTSCCTNGYEGYFPVKSAFDDGGYESRTARYVSGTAEKLTEEAIELGKSLK